jgi:hypothetical protein
MQPEYVSEAYVLNAELWHRERKEFQLFADGLSIVRDRKTTFLPRYSTAK